MLYEECDDFYKCKACPVSVADKGEGAIPITQDEGDKWYCTSCFYCEDICRDYSPRQYTINQRRIHEQKTTRMREPLQNLKEYGFLFDLNQSIREFRLDYGLPLLPQPELKSFNYLINDIMGELEKDQITIVFETKPEFVRKEKEEIAFFLGCLIPYRVPNYELSARQLLDKLGVKYQDLPFSCCGSIMTESQSEELWLTITAYNLAIAEKYGYKKIVSLCGGCSGNLRRGNQILSENKDKLKFVNKYLAKVSLVYSGEIIIEHLSEFLLKEEMQSKILTLRKQKHIQNLNLLKVATQVPCQVIRPVKYSPSATQGADLLRNLLTLTSITTIKYPFETFCCGSSMLQYDEDLAYKIAKKRINSLINHKADALIMGCGNCSMNFTVHQSEYSDSYLPTFFFTEILDYALGASNEEIDEIVERKRAKT